MKTHGKLKASITIETALILPIILGVVFTVLFLVVVMFQNTVLMALMDMDAARGVNLATDTYLYQDSFMTDWLLPSHDKFGYITGNSINAVSKNGLYIYNLTQNQPGILNLAATQMAMGDYDINFQLLKQNNLMDADVSLNTGGSVISGAKILSPHNALSGVFGGAGSIKVYGVASRIDPSQYIRETDSKCAILKAYTTVWDSRMNDFLSNYLADLFTKGTFSS